MAIVKVLYVDSNGDYTEVNSGADTIQAYGFDASGQQITNVAPGTSTTDAATYGQLVSMLNGFDWKDHVRAATTGALPAYTYANGTGGVGATITANANGALPAQDGVTLVNGDRLLVKDETGGNAPYNGIYVVTQVGDGSNPFILTRATDADSNVNIQPEMTVAVSEGTTLANHAYSLTTIAPITIGTTNLTFVKIVISLLQAGNGIDITGDVISAVVGAGLTFSGGAIVIDWATSPWNTTKAVKAVDLSSTNTGYGASIIGIEDAGNYTSQTTVEGALQELYSLSGAHPYTVGTGGVNAGDLVYLSGTNTVKKMPINAAHVAIGMAMATVSAGGTVEVKKFDTIILGAVAGASVDQKYYWNGSALTTTIPSGGGAYVWQAGVAINATDILADVVFIKRNA